MKSLFFGKNAKNSFVKALAAALAAALVLAMACGCSQAGRKYREASDVYSDFDGDGYMDEPFSNTSSDAEKPGDAESGEAKSEEGIQNKLIKEVTLAAETREFDKSYNALTSLAVSLGGYVDSSRVTGGRSDYSGSYSYDKAKQASIVLRIPADKLDTFLETAGNSVNVYQSSSNTTDVTLSYYDTKARIETLEAKRETLNNMLKEAKDVQTMLEIQDRLYETISEIESYRSRLAVMDNKVDYSTVKITLSEVKEYTKTEEQSFGERLAESSKEGWENFREGWEDFAVGFVGAIPGLLVFFAIVGLNVLVVVLIVNGAKKKAARARAANLKAKENNSQNTP